MDVVIKVTLASHEVVAIVAAHLREQFKGHAGTHEYIEVTRLGEPPPPIEVTIEAKRPSPSAWD